MPNRLGLSYPSMEQMGSFKGTVCYSLCNALRKGMAETSPSEREDHMTDQLLSTGVTLHLIDVGQGTPIVFIHGATVSGRFFERQIPYFSHSYRVLIPDLRGHGQSEKILHGYTVATYARDLQALFEARHIEHPVLVGWSMGAMVAYEYVQQFGQEQVAGLVIVDQSPSDFAWEGYKFGLVTLQELSEVVEMLQTDQRTFAEQFAGLMQHAPSSTITTWMVEELMRVPAAIATSILVNQTSQDYRPFLAEIHLPTLLLFGRDNKVTPPEAGEYMARRIPGAQLQIFEQSSHCPFYEEAEAFNERLQLFLDQITAASASR
jgi:non-heme chloroperoxidase